MRIASAVQGCVILLLPTSLLAQARPECARMDSSMHAAAGVHAHSHGSTCGAQDSAFAEMQARGRQVMGVDQYTSIHHFDSLSDGGRIVLQREAPDFAGTRAIREHLRRIATSFAAGDFSSPFEVHDQEVPGTRLMAQKRAAIRYAYRPLPRGGEIRIRTSDPEAIRAIHEFLASQRQEHHAAGRTRP